jgi:hypothetical protein
MQISKADHVHFYFCFHEKFIVSVLPSKCTFQKQTKHNACNALFRLLKDLGFVCWMVLCFMMFGCLCGIKRNMKIFRKKNALKNFNNEKCKKIAFIKKDNGENRSSRYYCRLEKKIACLKERKTSLLSRNIPAETFRNHTNETVDQIKYSNIINALSHLG